MHQINKFINLISLVPRDSVELDTDIKPKDGSNFKKSNLEIQIHSCVNIILNVFAKSNL